MANTNPNDKKGSILAEIVANTGISNGVLQPSIILLEQYEISKEEITDNARLKLLSMHKVLEHRVI